MLVGQHITLIHFLSSKPQTKFSDGFWSTQLEGMAHSVWWFTMMFVREISWNGDYLSSGTCWLTSWLFTDLSKITGYFRYRYIASTYHNYRRKFRSQTSDNMDRWKAEVGRVREEKGRRKITKRESFRRKKIQVCEKVGKSRNIAFFQWFVVPEGRKVGLLKRRVRSPLARWEMKNCTPLWREAHLQVKKLKAPHVRNTFGSWDVEKVHAVVARSTFASEKTKNTARSEHFWKLRCRKSGHRCGAKHISTSKW